ncbi:MAG: enoyl-CoA hydratase-related protein [Bacteroidetes bacterium]|nr:enoyl-CoA hydratase-related protein [Bacteroidota bacterium]
MTFENILTASENNIFSITINRPDKLNALNKKTIEELSEALLFAEGDINTRAIILTGSGQKAFVAGADISEFANFSINQGKTLSAEGHDKLFNLTQNLRTPVIAAINGFALGGGLELAMSCHIRVASDNAKMGLPEVSLGVIPGYGGTQRLAQLVGKGKALEMIMTADMISAADALTWGLVNYVTTPETLLAKCNELAVKIISRSPVAVAAAIRAVNANYADGVNGFAIEIDEFGTCFGTEDFKEGTTAFLEKRKAVFTGK